MSKKEEWVDGYVGIDKLNLDLQNPRVPKHIKGHNDVDKIRNYLVEREGVLRIARSIAKNGYHRSAVTIVCKEGGKLVVLDGNRRLAACELLLKPSLAINTRDRKELEDLGRTFDKKILENIKIAIAPSRKEAEKEIWDIHVNPILKPWQVLQKLRMYRNLIDSGEYNIKTASAEYGISASKFEQELAKLFFYEQILEFAKTEKDEQELLKSGFNKIDRLFLSSNGKKLLNYSADINGNIVFSSKKESEIKIKNLATYVIDPNKVPAQATQEFLIENVFSKIDPKSFPVKKENKIKTVDIKVSTTPTKTTTLPKGTSAKVDWVTPEEYTSYKGGYRVKEILKELNKNKPVKDENINILAVSLRVVLELAIYEKLKNSGGIKKIVADNKQRCIDQKKEVKNNWTPSLKEMLSYLLVEANGIITDPNDVKALNKVMRDRKDFVDSLDYYIHNASYNPTETSIREIWKTFCRPIFDIISKMK